MSLKLLSKGSVGHLSLENAIPFKNVQRKDHFTAQWKIIRSNNGEP